MQLLHPSQLQTPHLQRRHLVVIDNKLPVQTHEITSSHKQAKTKLIHGLEEP